VLDVALALVRSLRQVGAQIEVDDGQLRVTASAGALTEALKQELVFHKTAVLALFATAFQLLNERGARLIPRDAGTAVAVWRDADGRDLRDALEVIGHGEAEVLHLDDLDSDIPERYRQFVPEYVLRIWERRGLSVTGQQRIQATARARRLNLFFDTYGTSPRPCRITVETVLHGMLRQAAAGK
jgi:hypothetical protein